MKLLRRLAAMLSPIPQNPNAVMFGWHKGMPVRLRPVFGKNNVILDWILDPSSVAYADSLVSQAPPAIPGEASQPTSGDAPAPGGFNPAGVAGL